MRRKKLWIKTNIYELFAKILMKKKNKILNILDRVWIFLNYVAFKVRNDVVT